LVRDKVIVGSGVVARAFAEARGLRGCVIYAAGVSNSSCADESEYQRDRERLGEGLRERGLFVYFSTCAAGSEQTTPYVEHKRAMERLVKERRDYLICRLPVVAGKTPNPHTLLNYLYSRIARSERFTLQTRAKRNIVDVADVATVVEWLIRDGLHNETVNIASPENLPVTDIVRAFERLCRKEAVATRVDAGDEYPIYTDRIAEAPVDFSDDYLGRVLERYYV